MTDADWLNAIRAAPEDTVARLAYADWLDERDDPRGEFVRLEAELIRVGETGPSAAPIRQRLGELAVGTDIRWRESVTRVHLEAGPPFDHPHRHPLNVPGPFYTCGGCMACEAPEAEAPNLLAPLGPTNIITHFVRQPTTPDEVERACRAISICCVTDLRYGGTDPKIIRALGNDPSACDYLIRDDQPAPVACVDSDGIARTQAAPWEPTDYEPAVAGYVGPVVRRRSKIEEFIAAVAPIAMVVISVLAGLLSKAMRD